MYMLPFIQNSLLLSKILEITLFHTSLVLKSSNIWKMYMLPFIPDSLLLSKILEITQVKDQIIARAGDKDATELQALPTSTEIDVDLRELLLEVTESQAIA